MPPTTPLPDSKLWHYLAFGLRFISDFAIPELLPAPGGTNASSVTASGVTANSMTANGMSAGCTATADVRIRAGTIDASHFGGRRDTSHFIIQPDFFYFVVKDVARYLVTGGNEIIIEAWPDAKTDAINTFLLGSCCGALLFQRRLLPLHGSAVATAQGAVLILGESGAGKSTLAASLNGQGFPLLSDDVCAIGFSDTPVIFPAYPQMKLTPQSAVALGMVDTGTDNFSAYEEKFHLRNPSFYREPLALTAIYLLEKNQAASAAERQLRGAEKFTLLRNNVYRDFYIPEMKLDAQVFQQCATISGHCAVFQLSRSETEPTFDLVAAFIGRRFTPLTV